MTSSFSQYPIDASPTPCVRSVVIGVASGNIRSNSLIVMSCVMKQYRASDPQGSWIIGSMYTLNALRMRPMRMS